MSKNAINAIRILSADAVQKANSGHPGFPLGAAPIIYELFANHLKHDPGNPDWFDRDRFVLSAGHGSAMLYSVLHLFGYPKMTIDELRNFRQFGSLTPGHPEYRHTPGVDASTGPLGAGLGMAVGMAIAEAHLASKFNRDDLTIIDHFTFAMCGEGCLMEGISSEVLSLAGTLGLGKLIVLFDSNDITIEGSTDLAFTEDVCARMEAFGFQTLTVEDGTDTDAIGKAIEEAKAEQTKPSFIKIKTTIGYGVPDRAGTAKSHGEPIGEDNIPILRKNLDWPYEERFFVPDELYAEYKALAEEGAAKRSLWDERRAEYRERNGDASALFDSFLSGSIKDGIIGDSYYDFEAKPEATRSVSSKILGEFAAALPNMIGGSADLGPSNKTVMKAAGDFSASDRTGRNIHFGVRELGMTAIGNGIALHGGLIPYVATFFVFSDYMKPMLRLSALMGLPLIAILTHDSIGVGEDGPTHQPIEQLAMLRAIPGLNVWRPADEFETRAAWKNIIFSDDTPAALVLSRQNLPLTGCTGKDAEKGAYIVYDSSEGTPDAIIFSCGSELAPSVDAAKQLEAEGKHVRIVSVPCLEVFEAQDDNYKESVAPSDCSKRMAVEAGSSLSWGKLVGPAGAYVCMDCFGASAPAQVLFENFGFSAGHIAEVAKTLIG